jgi:hypothetical protein
MRIDFMTDRLTITQLLDWLEGRLREDEAVNVAAIVKADESYEPIVSWLRTFLDFSKSTVLVEPPNEMFGGAAAYFRAVAHGNRQSRWLQRLAATLISDSWQMPSLVSVRHTGLGAPPRQLVYTAPTADIVLNTREGLARETFDLMGQVFPTDGADPAAFTVQLMQQEWEAALTYTNKLGKFNCTGLPAGAYTIVIRGDLVEIAMADVGLSA